MAQVTLQGSERAEPPGSRLIGPADPNERLEVSVIVRRRAPQALQSRVAQLTSGDRSAGHLSREEFAQRHGADSQDLAAIRHFAAAHGLSVTAEHADRRTVMLAGTVQQFNAAFSIELKQYSHPDRNFRGRTGVIQLPAELNNIVEAVLGLDNRPQAKPHFRLSQGKGGGKGKKHASAGSYTPIQVAEAYGFPAGTGQGQCVAIIELGGGFKTTDLTTYFSGLKVGSPSVAAVSVDSAQNAPTGSADGPDGEVMLDIEVVGAIAPAAKIVVYFAPNTDAGFLDAITTAVHDTTHKPSVVSISWGGAEANWTSQAMTAMDSAFQAAVSMGVSVCVASGDSGSSDGLTGDHVDFPASSPNVLGCGGTRLSASGSSIASEVVWNDGSTGGASGGGVSTFFALPSWQDRSKATKAAGAAAPLSMRGVPDVAGNADPETGYAVRIDGADTVIGGTSAVAPLWAALIARLNQSRTTTVGFLNATLYAGPQSLRDITQGNNGDFAASQGWDACTGLGSPNGPALSKVL
jgi:kumamolisin